MGSKDSPFFLENEENLNVWAGYVIGRLVRENLHVDYIKDIILECETFLSNALNEALLVDETGRSALKKCLHKGESNYFCSYCGVLLRKGDDTLI